MKKFHKRLAMFLALTMVLASLLSGCQTKKLNPVAGTTSTASTASTEKVTIKMFMSNSGLVHPQGVDPSDNSWINIVEKYANVDLQVEVPSYADFQVKLNLLLSSGDLPDIVHSPVSSEMILRADEGAFIDLKKYYDKSAPVKAYITQEMMDMSKSTSGHYFRIPMAYFPAGTQGNAVYARWDLVKKYNDNKWPESVDQWIEMMRKMHTAEPNSIVMSNKVLGNNVISYGGVPIYYWYGALPYDTRYDYETGKALSTFTLPEYKAATKVMKQLYDEGILDKEFATTDAPKWSEKLLNKNVLLDVNSNEQKLPSKAPTPQTKDWETLAAPQLKKFPAEVKDPKYTEPFRWTGISNHGLYISSKSKIPDRAWKVIEGFASKELWEAIFWGKEGQEYTVEGGKRIPIPAKITDPSRTWSVQLALIFGFTAGQEVKKATGELAVGKEYSDMVYKSIEPFDIMAKKNGPPPTSFINYSDEAKLKLPEMQAFISQATIETIMGKITLDDFDLRVKDFQQKYGFYYDDITKQMKDNKDDFAQKGVNYKR